MTPLRRVALTLACAGILVPLCRAAADDPADARFRPNVDPYLTAKLEAARDEIRREAWDLAVAKLQQMLDLNDDPTVAAGDDNHPRWAGVHAEAQALIAGLPPAGRKAYQAAQGPRAADLLKEAVKEKDEQKTADVVRRFLNTDAGPDALAALAALEDEAGRHHLAAACYERLLALGADGIRIGDRKLDRDEMRKELSKQVKEDHDWPTFGGDAGRSAQPDGGMPFVRYDWVTPTDVPSRDLDGHSQTFKEKLTALFKTASDHLSRFNQPVLPPMFPVTAAISMAKDGKKHQLVVFRTHSGISACDMTGGKMLGRAPVKGSLEWMMYDARENTLNQWAQMYVGAREQPGQRPGVLFENTTIGTLSTDGRYAYAVEDLALPPPALHSFRGVPGNPNPYGWPQDILDAVGHSRLMAYDLAAGCKTAWEAPEAGDKTGPLADSYFIGPPLPLDGRLFVLNEKQGELRLVGLETTEEKKGGNKPHLSFVLPLGTVKPSMGEDSVRRIHAALVSYGDGVLVCPTGAGCVVGVDLPTRTVAWVRPYETTKAEAPAVSPIIRGRTVRPVGRAESRGEWRFSAPVVSGGAVVVAPPDGDALLCLDSKTGEVRWNNPRERGDLYLAGAFDGRVLVVGEKTCRAYGLKDGKPLWRLDAGLPSGRGVASGAFYYLPLRESAATKRTEICAIDLIQGKIVARASLSGPAIDRKTDALGNLLFADGELVSQTLTEVAAFPPLKTKLARMDETLAKNPDDPAGRYDRAELRAENGDLPGAVDDLREVIAAKPPEDLLARARVRLFDDLTQLLSSDFDKGEKYLKEYEEFAGRGNDAEVRRRRVLYHQLTGRGYEAQGRLLDALKAYEEAGRFGDDPLPSPDDPALTVSPAAWAAGRIADLLRKATPDQRKQLQEEIDRRLKGAKASDKPDELRAFAALFDASTAAGRDARLELAERLLVADARGLEAELLLTAVARQRDDPASAGRAVEALARLSTRIGLLEDAVYYYRVLDRDYATVKIRDGRTGAEFLDYSTDKRFLPFLGDQSASFEKNRLRAKIERGDFAPKSLTFRFTHERESAPLFRHRKPELTFETSNLALVDPATGEAHGKTIPVSAALFQSLATFGGGPESDPGHSTPDARRPPPAATPLFPYQTVGRLAVVPVGPTVLAVDAAEGELLWRMDPPARPGAPAPPQPTPGDDRDGDLLALYADRWLQRVGPGAELLTPSALCLMTRDGLTAFDPRTGRTLWRRDDVTAGARLFGDDARLCIVEGTGDRPRQTRAFRVADGADLRAPDFGWAYERRQQVVGADLLTADAGKDGLTLRLLDPLADKELWKETYPVGSVPLTCLTPLLTGAATPDGKVHVVDLLRRKEVLAGEINPKHLDHVETIYLLADGKLFYLACNAALGDNNRVNSNLYPATGLRDLPINGELYAFDAATGKPRWRVTCPQQRLLLEGFADLPVIVYEADQSIYRGPFGGGSFEGAKKQSVVVRVQDKRTGKLLLDIDDFKGGPFYNVAADAGGRVELTAPQAKVVIASTDK